MSQRSLHISLPPGLIEFVKRRVASGRYATPSEYIRELIRRDEEREVPERIESQLLEGLDSGDATPMTAEDWKSIREEGRRRI